MRTMAASLGRAPSSISREIGRNGGRQAYRASEADASAWQRARRPKRCKLAVNWVLAHLVAEKLRLQWSPSQVAGWLKRMYPKDKTRQVSHETIYRTLFIQARGALKKERKVTMLSLVAGSQMRMVQSPDAVAIRSPEGE